MYRAVVLRLLLGLELAERDRVMLGVRLGDREPLLETVGEHEDIARIK